VSGSTALPCEEAVALELDSIAFAFHLLGSLVQKVWTGLYFPFSL
jgi:hypothetical protein